MPTVTVFTDVTEDESRSSSLEAGTADSSPGSTYSDRLFTTSLPPPLLLLPPPQPDKKPVAVKAKLSMAKIQAARANL